MRISDRGIELIKRFEGYSSLPYQDAVGVWTIGYGTTRDVDEGTPRIDKVKAEKLLLEDLRRFQDAIEQFTKVPLTQNQFDALCSFVYNVGIGAYKRSTLLKKLNKGDYDAVPVELMKWNKAGGRVLRGLTRRRTAEANLWQENLEMEPVGAIKPQRDVPTIVNAENISAAGSVVGGVAAMNLEPNNPLAWALAAVVLVGSAVFLYLFLKRRGA